MGTHMEGSQINTVADSLSTESKKRAVPLSTFTDPELHTVDGVSCDLVFLVRLSMLCLLYRWAGKIDGWSDCDVCAEELSDSQNRSANSFIPSLADVNVYCVGKRGGSSKKTATAASTKSTASTAAATMGLACCSTDSTTTTAAIAPTTATAATATAFSIAAAGGIVVGAAGADQKPLIFDESKIIEEYGASPLLPCKPEGLTPHDIEFHPKDATVSNSNDDGAAMNDMAEGEVEVTVYRKANTAAVV